MDVNGWVAILVGLGPWYSMSHKMYTFFCREGGGGIFVWVVVKYFDSCMWCIYTYPIGLLHWPWGRHMFCNDVVYLPISFRVTPLALGQSHDCPSANESTLKDIGENHYYQTTMKCMKSQSKLSNPEGYGQNHLPRDQANHNKSWTYI